MEAPLGSFSTSAPGLRAICHHMKAPDCVAKGKVYWYGPHMCVPPYISILVANKYAQRSVTSFVVTREDEEQCPCTCLGA